MPFRGSTAPPFGVIYRVAVQGVYRAAVWGGLPCRRSGGLPCRRLGGVVFRAAGRGGRCLPWRCLEGATVPPLGVCTVRPFGVGLPCRRSEEIYGAAVSGVACADGWRVLQKTL